MIGRIIVLAAVFIPQLKGDLGKVPQPPVLIKETPRETVLFQRWKNEHDSIVLECEAEGYPEPEYTWSKFYLAQFDWHEYRLDNKTGTIIFKDPSPDLISIYKCCATNMYGKACSYSTLVLINVLENPTYNSVYELKYAKLGEPFKLSYDNMPKHIEPSTFFWIIQTKTNLIKKIDSPRITADDQGNLWFSNITYNDLLKDEWYTLALASKNSIKYMKQFVLEITETRKPVNSYVVEQYTTNLTEPVMIGKNLDLYCIYGGNPLPEISWFKNDIPLKFDERILLNNHGKLLTLKNTTYDDDGKYTCIAKNGNQFANQEEKSFLVEVQVTVEVEKILISEGEYVELKCKVDGNPKPQISWSFNGDSIYQQGDNFIIRNASPHDTGVYTCRGYNINGSDRKNIALTVFNAPPTFVNIEDDLVFTKEGQTILFDCKVFGTPTPKITWSHNGQPLVYNKLIAAESNSHFTIFPNGSLEVQNISTDDEGEYVCEAINKFGSAKKSNFINIKEEYKIFNVIEPFSVEVLAGSTLSLKCNLKEILQTNEPSTWSGYGLTTFGQHGSHIINGDLLTIHQGSVKDSEIYSCKNSLKNTEVSVAVNFVNLDEPTSSQEEEKLDSISEDYYEN